MHLDGAQRWVETRVIQALKNVRKQDAKKANLQQRTPDDWLNAVIERLGLLSVAGVSEDEQGDEVRDIQLFHQSFQEYFAAQALLHSRAIYDEIEPLERLRQHVCELTMTIEEQKVASLGSGQRTEPVVADRWKEVVSLCLAKLSQEKNEQTNLGIASADDAILLTVPSQSMSTEKARALATFALKSLAENEPDLRQSTIDAALNAAIDNINELDGRTSKPNTLMDEAFQAIKQSRFNQVCRDRLIQSYIQARDLRRVEVGFVLLAMLDHEVLSMENAAQILDPLLEKLIAAHSIEESVEAALRLTNTLFYAQGAIDFLPDILLRKIVSTLLTTVKENDEAISTAAMGAMSWLVRETYSVPHTPYTFVERELDCLRQIVTNRNRDATTRSKAAYILGACGSERTVFAQINWIHEWIVIADGHKPHRQLSIVVPVDHPQDIKALRYAISSNLPERAKRTIAIALGRLVDFGGNRATIEGSLNDGMKRCLDLLQHFCN